jgi:hypothetical protein
MTNLSERVIAFVGNPLKNITIKMSDMTHKLNFAKLFKSDTSKVFGRLLHQRTHKRSAILFIGILSNVAVIRNPFVLSKVRLSLSPLFVTLLSTRVILTLTYHLLFPLLYTSSIIVFYFIVFFLTHAPCLLCSQNLLVTMNSGAHLVSGKS